MSPNTILSVSHNGFTVIIEVSGEEGIAVFKFDADYFIRLHYEGKHELLWTLHKPIQEGNATCDWPDVYEVTDQGEIKPR